MQNVKEEIKSIAFKSNNNQSEQELKESKANENNPLKLPDEFAGLISEFNLFSQTLSQINSNSNNNGMRYFFLIIYILYLHEK